jgi:outer membrane receptor protein involved in Fe transport
MNKKILFFICFVFMLIFHVRVYAQNFTISGYIFDSETSEILIGGGVHEILSKRGSSSNTYGFYNLVLEHGKNTIMFSYLGYESMIVDFTLTKDTVIHAYMKPATDEISAIDVNANHRTSGKHLGRVDLHAARIKSIPALFGEADLFRAILFVPGVQPASEGKSTFSVRGGSPDQNLILLDGVPVYNPNHVFGFLSIFNTDAIKKVTIYKSSFPARFGGRLSSVVDIATKDGNKQTFSGSVTVGLPAVKLDIEGPIIKDKTSFTFSARRTYIDFILNALNNDIEDNTSNTNLFFHDLNAKINHRIDNKTFIYISVYNGRDVMDEKTGVKNWETNHVYSSQRYDWGNSIVTGKISSALRPNLFFKSALTFNQYNYKLKTADKYMFTDENKIEHNTYKDFLFSSSIRDYSVSTDFEYSMHPKHKIYFGGLFMHHRFSPEVISFSVKGDSIVKTDNKPKITHARESALYVEDEWDITEHINMNAGLRFSAFNVDKQTYSALDPRLTLRFLLNKRISLQASYTKMQQYIHLLSNSAALFQTDLWVPVTGRVKPMRSNQYSFGIFHELTPHVLLSVESYYKDMQNVVEYKDGASFTGVSAGWEGKIEAGIGRAYGVEFSVQKQAGKFTGTVSYTLSKTERRFDEINYGKWFPARYDRRHLLNIICAYKASDKFNFTAAWVYHSGSRITLPLMTFVPPDVPDRNNNQGIIADLMELDNRNNYKMPPYHRLDLGVDYTFGKRSERQYFILAANIYNAYNRMNPYRLIIESDMHHSSTGEHTYTRNLKQITLFAIVPALSLAYHF